MKETILKNEFVTLWYYPEKKIISHKIHKFLTGRPFRELFTKGTDLLIEHGAEKWLSDDREYYAMHPSDREWADNEWSPRAIAAGWKYWAMVLPENILGKMSTNQIVEATPERGLEVRVFATPEEGIAWLESK